MCSKPKKNVSEISDGSPLKLNTDPGIIGNNFSKEIYDRLQTAVTNLQNNQINWDAAHKRGLNLCKFIESIKVKSMGATSTSSQHQQQQQIQSALYHEKDLYPETMQNPCEALKDIQAIFQNILMKAADTEKCITGLVKLCGDSNEIPYRTWNIRNFHNFAKCILESYRNDYELKKTIIENIAHSKSRLELILHTSAWQYSSTVDDDQKLLFRFLALETDKR